MKNKRITKTIKYTGIGIFLGFILFSCSEDYLDRKPLDALTKDNFFDKASNLKVYVNSLYDRFAWYDFTWRGSGPDDSSLDVGSDVAISGRNIPGNLNQISATGQAANDSNTWNNLYKRIRDENYFLYYAEKNAEKTSAANHYKGEAYFFRAWDYFDLLRSFGDVPLIKENLTDKDTKKIYTPRSSRDKIAQQIIDDLDKAIAVLNWKGDKEAVSGRVNKESALALKARVALYEGSWEYYHNKYATPFAVKGKDGKNFLELVAPAVQQLIDKHGSKIFNSGTEPYTELFTQTDASSVPGVFLYRVYDASKLNRSHNFFLRALGGYRVAGITGNLVDQYLNKNGTPQPPLASGAKYQKTLNQLSSELDPRFRQTVWTPDRGAFRKLSSSGNPFRYPVIAGSSGWFTSTGYRRWKGAILDPARQFNGEADGIFIRYGEALLAYAEAKAILGTITQSDLDKTVNVLRNRVKMTSMNLGTINTFSNYNQRLGFDLSEANIVNEIRRERCIELVLEGFRLDDLKRWGIFEKVINGLKPYGAQLQEFIDYYNDKSASGLLAKDIEDDKVVKLADIAALKRKDNVGDFDNGRINPLFKSPQFQSSGQGLFINPKRDYLSAIPRSQIQLYQANSGVTLTQNPGWN